jgi:hypothetical protein
MLVTFKTKDHADITMFGDVAIKLLRLMGHSGTIPSAVKAEDVPSRLVQLKRAIDAEPAAVAADNEPKNRDAEAAPPVSLRQRAYPLIQLFEAAARSGADVMWDGSGNR